MPKKKSNYDAVLKQRIQRSKQYRKRTEKSHKIDFSLVPYHIISRDGEKYYSYDYVMTKYFSQEYYCYVCWRTKYKAIIKTMDKSIHGLTISPPYFHEDTVEYMSDSKNSGEIREWMRSKTLRKKLKRSLKATE